MTAIDDLRATVAAIPMPGAPPRVSKDGAIVGLAFLDAALRQNHIRRLTQRLVLAEHRAASVHNQLDVSLGLLDPMQRDAARMFQQLRARTLGDQQCSPRTLWLPVARVSRRSASPVDVRDAQGQLLPRLTQYEISRLLAAAMYEMLKGILSGLPEAHDRDALVHGFLHGSAGARWLVQAGLLTMLTEKSRLVGYSCGKQDETTQGEPSARDVADSILQMGVDHTGALHSFSQVLSIAANDRILIVALDDSLDEHLLSYSSPTYERHALAVENAVSGWRFSTANLAGQFKRFMQTWEGDTYDVEYQTSIPASLRAYHLIASAPEAVDIAEMSMSSDADQGVVMALRRDLQTISLRPPPASRTEAQQGEDDRLDANPAVTSLETHAVLLRLGDLLRRRRADALSSRQTFASSRTTACDELVAQAERRDGELKADGQLQTLIDRATRELEVADLGCDFTVEDDPAAASAHAYWRRSPGRFVRNELINVTAHLRLQDTSPNRLSSIWNYCFGVTAVAVLTGLFLLFNPPPTELGFDRGAVVALLLLVPGFLYSRLDFPHAGSVEQQLRRRSFMAARMAIYGMILLASAVAAGVSGGWLALLFIMCIASLVVVLSSGRLTRHHETDRLFRTVAPAYLTPTGDRPIVRFAAQFTSTGTPSSDEDEAGWPHPQALADLARGCHALLREPSPGVSFEIHHVEDRPDYLFELLGQQPNSRPLPNDDDTSATEEGSADPLSQAGAGGSEHTDQPTRRRTDQTAPAMAQTLSSSAYGIGLVIGTRPAKTRQHQSKPKSSTGEIVFRGFAKPNPQFIYEQATALEGVVVLRDTPGVPTLTECQLLRDALVEVATVARDEGCPLLLLQSPVQTGVAEAETANGNETWPRSQCLAMRFAIALHADASMSSTVIQLSNRIANFCTERGYAYWAGDNRLGRRQGNWVNIVAADTTRLSEQGVQSEPLSRYGMPVTLVGPARVGSTAAVLQYLRRARTGVGACSVTALDDLAFIHLQLPIKYLNDSEDFDDYRRLVVDRASTPAHALLSARSSLQAALDLCHRSLSTVSLSPVEQDVTAKAALADDYQVFFGPPLTLTAGGEQKPIWFSWQMEGGSSKLDAALLALSDAVRTFERRVNGLPDTCDGGTSTSIGATDYSTEVLAGANLEYVVCRDMGNGTWRGRGKMALELEFVDRAGMLEKPTRLCVTLEDLWRERLAHDSIAGVTETTVAWRERWLGRWSSHI